MRLETAEIPTPPSRRRRVEERVRRLLSEGKPGAALREWSHYQHFLPEAQLPPDVLRKLFEGLLHVRMWQESAMLMEEYVARFADDADAVCVQAAGVLLHRLGRPRAALRMLQVANWQSLPESLQERSHELAAAARELIDSGVIELSSPAFPAPSS